MSPNQSSQEKPPARAPNAEGGGPSIWLQLAAAFAVFLVLSAGYSFVRDYLNQQKESIPLSQVATDIAAGKITNITVEGDSITATYTDKTEKTSRKDPSASLPETLATYGVIQVSRPVILLTDLCHFINSRSGLPILLSSH